MPTEVIALFSAISSFAIRARLQYYIIGTVEWGEIKPNLFVHITLHSSLVLPLRISKMEQIEFSEEEKYQLLIVDCDDEDELDLVLAMNAGLEEIRITASGHSDDSQD